MKATINTTAKVHYIPGHAPSVDLCGTQLLRIAGTHYYHHVGAVPRGQSARKEFQGPLIEGPWAYTFGSAAILSSSKAANEAYAAERAAAVEVRTGDELEIDGVWYTVNIARREFIELIKFGG